MDMTGADTSESQHANPGIIDSSRIAGCPCPVDNCPEMIASSMVTRHLEKHCSGLLPGQVPDSWLFRHRRYICKCNRIFAESFRSRHSSKCASQQASQSSTTIEPVTDSNHVFKLPSLDEVMRLQRPTLKFVPAKARQKFGYVLSEAIKQVVNENSVDSWTKLLMLPKCVLPSSKRAGKRHQHKTSINMLCDKWSNGHLEELWEAAKVNSKSPTFSKPKSRSSQEEYAARIAAAIDQAEDGLYGKACRILSSSGLCPNNDITWTKLNDKHPKVPPPSVSEYSNETELLQLSSSFDMMEMLRSFPQATACGPSGLRVQHLINACEAVLPISLTASLRHLVNLLISGKSPIDLAPYIAGGNLTALKKTKGDSWDVRPIVVGEVIRRLSAKCICSLIRQDIITYFLPLQIGVSCKNGTEKIIHRVRAVTHDHWNDPDFCILKVDMANAFNSVSRKAVLDQCYQLFPKIHKWITWCYGCQPFLWHTMGRISSCQGVQQGDPLGPFLFALALHPVVKAIESSCSLLHHCWYLDDGILAGKKEEVLKAYEVLCSQGGDIGLKLQTKKCELFGKGNLDDFCPDFLKSNSANFEVLGSPVGDHNFCSEFIENKRVKSLQLLNYISRLRDPQVSLSLLRTCAGFCRMTHLARTVPPECTEKAFGEFDKEVRKCLEESIAIELSEEAWIQCQLKVCSGGLGVRSTMKHSSAAYLASLSASLPAASIRSNATTYDSCLQAISSYNSMVEEQKHLANDFFISSTPSQKHLSTFIDSRLQKTLMTSASPAHQIRLHSVSSPDAAKWLTVVPSPGLGFRLSPEEFQVLIKWWLGLPMTTGKTLCPRCPGVSLDPLGHHALTCKRGSFVTSRHNALRDQLNQICEWANLRPAIEKGAGCGHSDPNRRPADILLPDWSLGRPAAVDLTVVHPLINNTVPGASTTEGSTLLAAEKRKHTSNDNKCEELGWICIPMVPMAVTAYGSWGEEALYTFSRVASRLSTQTSVTFSEAREAIMRKMSIALMRHNSRAMLSMNLGEIGRHELVLAGASSYFDS